MISPHEIGQPYESLISSGCDSRLILNPSGLNPYGCGVISRDVIALGSCSASTPSARGEQAARAIRQSLIEASDLRTATEHQFQSVREALHACWNLTPETDIAFTPSGTDVELLALSLADGVAYGSAARPIVNIVIGPAEVGRGTVRSASFQHHDRVDPCGHEVALASPVDEAMERRVTVQTIDIRHANGQPMSCAEIDLAVQQAVIAAADQGSRVLLHAVAHSKTGIFAPRLTTLSRIATTMTDDVVIVVDAAQARLGPTFGTIDYSQLIRHGFLVSVTGSKFFGGPPFCGALLVPPRYQRPRSLPSGLSRYVFRNQLPLSWSDARNCLRDDCNVSLLMRWNAAVAEMRAFYALPERTRGRIASAFVQSVRRHFAAEESIELMPSFDMEDSDWIDQHGTPTPTVISFGIHSGGQRFGERELRSLHQQLNEPAGEGGELAFHLGQPVRIGNQLWVLRIALGAPLVTEIASNSIRGETLSARLSWLDHRLSDLAHRITDLANAIAVSEPSRSLTTVR
ncbi:hypothetical protein [Stieleria varia]|uniref:Cysteine desulfurase n=1 Tax=Stieleria varia TaxID=2528005 RepID=A0A5C6B0A9_9BACT|nr:hypothetical protein [Stieleria varia]TWU04889.1 hypothetical protein Pla52n_29340 [Stieleria varia]